MRKKIKHYKISCQSYETPCTNADGTYVVRMCLDNGFNLVVENVETIEKGLEVINDVIKDLKFHVIPDLTVYKTSLFGSIVYADN